MGAKTRECLKCQQSFQSLGPENRICPRCNLINQGGDSSKQKSVEQEGLLFCRICRRRVPPQDLTDEAECRCKDCHEEHEIRIAAHEVRIRREMPRSEREHLTRRNSRMFLED